MQVALVGVADGKTPLQKPTKFTNGKQWTVDYTGANQKLSGIAAGAGAKFLGSLNTFDPNIAKGDGIHPFNGYSKLFQAGSSIAAPASKDTADNKEKDSTAVPFSVEVPDGKRGPLIADAQKALEALGVPLPKYGVDGIQGKETTGAIKTFQEKNGLEATGIVNQQTADKMNAMLKAKPEVLATLTKSTNKDVKSLDYSRGAEEVAALTSTESTQKARATAEKYLGRPMDDKEWNYLLRATTAEASNNSKEQAYVMGVILNRTRTGNWGDNVISVLRAPNQFQAVTGTRFDPGPSANFTRGPTDRQLANIVDGAINILPQVPTNLKYFTAASSAAYGAGTNIGFRDKMIAAGGEKIGGTIFAAQV
jgi:peptidoglycan hydrolase-like protein with peptidoglycan-binding domain